MNQPWIAVAVILLAFAGAKPGQTAQIQPPAAASEDESCGEIAGVVISATTGETLKGVLVELVGRAHGVDNVMGASVMRQALAADGPFAFTQLPAGEYWISGSKSGYSKSSRFPSRNRVMLGRKSSREDLVLRLSPGAVVTGRVLDAYGEPLPEARVYALRRSFGPHGIGWEWVHSGLTNDLGEYRLYNLDAGKYIIRADPPIVTSPRGLAHLEFAPSFYAAAVTPEQAAELQLDWGGEVSGIDMQLWLAPSSRIEGIVVESTGRPCADCSVRIEAAPDFAEIGARATKEGLFVFQGVPSGPRRIVATGRASTPAFAAEPILIGEDKVKIELTLGPLQTIEGEVVLEKSEPKDKDEATAPSGDKTVQRAPSPRPIFVHFEGEVPDGWGGRQQAATPSIGGPFKIEWVPAGTYRIRVEGQPPGGYLRGVTLAGSRLDRPEIQVQSGSSISGLTLYITFDGATISGFVRSPGETDSRVEPPPARIFAFPDNDVNPYAARVMAYSELDGTFLISGIAPGRYTLYAVTVENLLELDDPAVRRTVERFARNVILSKNEQAELELIAIP